MNAFGKTGIAQIHQMNALHPTWRGTPVLVIGLHHVDEVLKRCYVRKLNGRSNAWEGWVKASQIDCSTGQESEETCS